MPANSATSSSLTVAYYLPQFHTIPENDKWWGEGFTEWVNVKKADPQYFGHDHPRIATDLGEYNLDDIQVMHRQSVLAKAHDINAFCFYHYWFDGQRLLEKPLNNYLKNGPDFPFCISWANENWTRRWDGKDHEVLIGQKYTDSTADEVFASFIPYLSDPRYLRVDGALVLVVHRMDHIPNAVEITARWRLLANQHGLGELNIIAAETKEGIHPQSFGVDAVAEFPPVGSNTLGSAQLLPVKGLSPDFRGRIMSYPRMARRFMRRATPSFTRYRAVAPGWDNTARRGRSATIYLDSSPAVYREWLAHARKMEDARQTSTGLVFINAWNEWAEGAYLEPDASWGLNFLEATRRGCAPLPAASRTHLGAPSRAWARSVILAGMGSGVSLLRKLKSPWR